MKECVTLPALASKLGVADITIYRWLRSGKLPPPDVSVGLYRGYSSESVIEIEEWFQARSRKTTRGLE